MGGLGSGYDVQGIIEKMIQARAQKRTSWATQKTELGYDITAWSDISSYMTALTDSLDRLRSFDLWNQKLATVSDSTKINARATMSAVEASYVMSVTDLAQSHSVRSKAFASSTADISTGGTNEIADGDQFDIGGVTFTVGADEYGQTLGGTETLASLAAKINYASSSMTENDRVVASVVSAGATETYLVLTRVKTGSTFINSSDLLGGSALQSLQVRTDAGPGDNYANVLINHQDASFTVNGITVTRSSNTGLSDVISGVTLDLLDETLSDVTLAIAPDRESAKTAILDFIQKYNEAAAMLTKAGKITTQGSSLDPNGATVSDKGELYNDTLVGEILRNMRTQAADSKYPTLNPINASYTYDSRAGIMDSLSDIGISTSSRDNQLSVIDEDRLETMLNTDFDKVEQLFRGVYSASTGYTGGVASDFYAYANGVSKAMTGTIAMHTQTLQDHSDRLQSQLDQFDIKLAEYEQDLWEQFTLMDTTIAKLQASLQGIKNITGGA